MLLKRASTDSRRKVSNCRLVRYNVPITLFAQASLIWSYRVASAQVLNFNPFRDGWSNEGFFFLTRRLVEWD